MGQIKITKVLLFLFLSVLFTTGCTNKQPIQRYGSVIGIKQENIAEYKRLHAAAWPEILSKLKEVHIRNYSIYLGQLEPNSYYLFSYFEYTGNDFKADMAKMAADPKTKEWWKHTDPLQSPVPMRKQGEWWAGMEEVFHLE
jgi:L-rhamnose mutarotase